MDNRFLLKSFILQLPTQGVDHFYFYYNEYQLTNMRQYNFIAVSIIYSALLVLESTPLPGGSVIRRPGSFVRIKAPGSPIQVEQYSSWAWGLEIVLVILLILLTGILAGLTLAVMSVDVTRLRVWMNTGGEKQRSVLDLHVSMYGTNSL